MNWKIKPKYEHRQKSKSESANRSLNPFLRSAKRHSRKLLPLTATMMQRCCTKLRYLAVQSRQTIAATSSCRFLHYSPHPFQIPSSNRLPSPLFNPYSSFPSTLALHAFRSSPSPPPVSFSFELFLVLWVCGPESPQVGDPEVFLKLTY